MKSESDDRVRALKVRMIQARKKYLSETASLKRRISRLKVKSASKRKVDDR